MFEYLSQDLEKHLNWSDKNVVTFNAGKRTLALCL